MTTRVRILNAAENHFAANGFHAASLANIAGDVGIRTPSLYRHFKHKRALYEEVLARLLDPWTQLLGDIIEPSDAEHAVSNLQVAVRHYLATPNLARLVQHAALAGGEELELVKRWYAPLLRRGAALSTRPSSPKRSPAMLILAFHAMLSGYVTLAPLHEASLAADPLGPDMTDAYGSMLEGLTRALWTWP